MRKLKKPPEKWLNRTTAQFKVDKKISDPAALAAWVWKNGISEVNRQRILKNPLLPLENMKYRKPKTPAIKRRKQLPKGAKMASRKRRSSGRRKMSGAVANYSGRRKSRRRRMSGEIAYYGGTVADYSGRRRSRRMSGGSRKMDIVKPLMNTALAVGGGIGGRLVKNAIPIQDERIKAAVPVILGLVISMMSRANVMLKNIGVGMATIGGAELLAALFPNVALLQGETPAQVAYTSQDVKEALNQGLISQDEANVLLQAAGYMGAIEDFSGQDESEGIGPDIQDITPEAANEPWETTENVM